MFSVSLLSFCATGFVLYLLYHFVDFVALIPKHKLCISRSILSASMHLKWQKHGLFCSFRLGGGRWSYPKWSRRLRQWLPHSEHPCSRLQVSLVVSLSLQSLSSLRCSDLFLHSLILLYILPSDSPPPYQASLGQSLVASRLNLKLCAALIVSCTSWW